jgi:hypothetical protein
MKTVPLVSLIALLLVGCRTADFAAYRGEQQNWPTQPGAFVHQQNGLDFYQGYPSKPYIVLGRAVASGGHTDFQLASCAKANHADAVMIIDSHDYNGAFATLPSASYTSYTRYSSLTTTTPGIAVPIRMQVQTAWLIKFQ